MRTALTHRHEAGEPDAIAALDVLGQHLVAPCEAVHAHALRSHPGEAQDADEVGRAPERCALIGLKIALVHEQWHVELGRQPCLPFKPLELYLSAREHAVVVQAALANGDAL